MADFVYNLETLYHAAYVPDLFTAAEIEAIRGELAPAAFAPYPMRSAMGEDDAGAVDATWLHVDRAHFPVGHIDEGVVVPGQWDPSLIAISEVMTSAYWRMLDHVRAIADEWHLYRQLDLVGLRADLILPEGREIEAFRFDGSQGHFIDDIRWMGRGPWRRRRLLCLVQLSPPESYAGGGIKLPYGRRSVHNVPHKAGSMVVVPVWQHIAVAPLLAGNAEMIACLVYGRNQFGAEGA